MAAASGESDQSHSTGNGTAVSSLSLISAEISATSGCSVTSNRSSRPFHDSPCAPPGSLRAASTFASSIHKIHGGTAHLYLTPITASLTSAFQHSAFTSPHFSGRSRTAAAAMASSADGYARDSGSRDCGALDKDDYSQGASQNRTNALATTWVHSPLPLAQQSGGEMQPPLSLAPESSAGASLGLSVPRVSDAADHARSSPASIASPAPDVLSVKPVSFGSQLVAPLPVVHQQRRSLRALEDGQRGTWSLNSDSASAGSSASSGATSPSVVTASQPSSRSDHSSSRANKSASSRTGALPLGKTEESEGVATTAPQQQEQQQENGGSDAPSQRRPWLGQHDDLLGASMCSLPVTSVATSMVNELPPPPPPPPSAQLSLRRGAKTGRGRSLSLLPPPRVSLTLRPLRCVDGAESHLRARWHTHTSDDSTADDTGGSVLNASTASGPQNSAISPRLWESSGSMKSFMLSHATIPRRSFSSGILILSAVIPNTSADGTGVSDANELSSCSGARQSEAPSQAQRPQCPSSAPSHNNLLVRARSPVNANGVEAEDIVELRQAVARPLSLSDRSSASASVGASAGNDAFGEEVDEWAGTLSPSINGASDALGKPLQSSESSAPRPQPPFAAGKTIRRAHKADNSEEHNPKASSIVASGKSKLQLVTALMQAPSLVSSDVSARAHLGKAHELSPRQQELAQSFRNRIQVGVRAPRRQRTVQRVSSPSSDRWNSNGTRFSSNRGSTASNGTSRDSTAERSNIARRRGDNSRRAKGQSTQQPVAALSFMAVALAAVGAAKLLRPVHVLRVRRRFDEVIAPAAAYRIQCKWRRCLQLRRVEQKNAVQLLVPWMRRRLQRLRRAKEASARLLQRVFRGEVVRSLHRYLYEQMKRHHALAVIRRYVQRWEAQNLYRGLQAQRDERAVVVGQCVQGHLRLFRAEQVAWNAIVQDGAAALHVRPCVSTQDWVEGVAALTGVVLDPCVSNRICSTNGSPAASTRARPITMVQLRELLLDLARLEHQLFRTSSIKEEKTVRSIKDSAHSSTGLQRPRSANLTHDARESVPVAAHNVDPSCTAAPTASVGASASPTLSSPTATDDDVVTAYMQLLCRTEATERAVLERRLLGEHRDILRGPLLLNRAVFYATTMWVPPLFSPLLLNMPSDRALHQAARLFKAERKARFEIIQLYESMPLACLHRPMLSPAANARQSDLVRLLNGVDDPWSDAERSERCFYHKTAAHKHLVSLASTTSKWERNTGLSYTPQPSWASLGTNDADGGGCHLPTVMVPPLPSTPQATSYGTASRPRVRMKVNPRLHHYANSPFMACLPSHVTSISPCPNNSAESPAPGGGGVSRTGEDDRQTNCFALARHHGRGDVQIPSAIPSPHRRLRGPPLPMLRKLLQSPSRAPNGTPRLSPQSAPIVATPTLSSREGVSGLQAPFSTTYPNTVHSTLASIRKSSAVLGERDAAVGAASSPQRSTSTRFTGVSDRGDGNQGYYCSTNGISQDTGGVAPRLASPLSIARRSGADFVGRIFKMHDATAAPFEPLPQPSTAHEVPRCLRQQNRTPISTRVGENASGVATLLSVPLPILLGPLRAGAFPVSTIAAAAAAEVADRRCATRWSTDRDHSPPQASLSLGSELRDGGVETGGGEADTELHPGQQQQSSSTASAACPVQVPTPLESCRVKTVDFPPSPVLSSSASTVAQAVADDWGLISPAPHRRRPPTPPPRQCHAADYVGESPERSAAHSVLSPHPTDRAGPTLSHNGPAFTDPLPSSHFHHPQHVAAAHSGGSTANETGAHSSGISSSDVHLAIIPRIKGLASPAAATRAAAVASTAQYPSLSVR